MRKLLTILLTVFLFASIAIAANTYVLDLSAKHYFYAADNASNELDVTGDFTIEAWVKCNNSSFTGRLCDRTGVLKIFASSADNSIRFDLDDGGGILSTGPISSDTWYHIAVSRSGTTTRIFLDGVSKASSNLALIASTEAFYVGGQATWFGAWDACLDEFRFSNVARYTTTFTPPTEPFSSDANTVLLYNFDNNTELPPANSSSMSFTHTNVGVVGGDYVTDNDLPLPVTLASFTAQAKNGKVELAWETATETNNANFIIYRNGEAIANVAGAGTTTEPQNYTYVDAAVVPGVAYTYVLADVDYANEETLYEGNAVTVMLNNDIVEADFVVNAAYPNPFNPSVAISYQLSANSMVKALIYNTNGTLVEELLNSDMSAGSHELVWNATNMTSGVYILKMFSGNIVNTQKLVLMK